MRKVKVKHKDGDMTGITMIYIFYLQIKKHKELWEIDVEEYALNRYYKGVLTKIIKTTEILVHRFENYINHTVINDVLTVLEREFKEFDYNETDVNLELLKTMFFAILIFDTANTHKKKMIGVVLKSMITDITKVFNEYVEMWIRDVDDNILKIKN